MFDWAKIKSKKAISWEVVLVILIAIMVGLVFYYVFVKGMFSNVTGAVKGFIGEQ